MRRHQKTRMHHLAIIDTGRNLSEVHHDINHATPASSGINTAILKLFGLVRVRSTFDASSVERASEQLTARGCEVYVWSSADNKDTPPKLQNIIDRQPLSQWLKTGTTSTIPTTTGIGGRLTHLVGTDGQLGHATIVAQWHYFSGTLFPPFGLVDTLENIPPGEVQAVLMSASGRVAYGTLEIWPDIPAAYTPFLKLDGRCWRPFKTAGTWWLDRLVDLDDIIACPT